MFLASLDPKLLSEHLSNYCDMQGVQSAVMYKLKMTLNMLQGRERSDGLISNINLNLSTSSGDAEASDMTRHFWGSGDELSAPRGTENDPRQFVTQQKCGAGCDCQGTSIFPELVSIDFLQDERSLDVPSTELLPWSNGREDNPAPNPLWPY
ncbi:hypothetical protein SKAU_G00056100 [Synaphobranchus kaupii]|uniref:Uncharacterized protein n=1 Tax=Synaphobranchus kaupii TaxID=118154 RepID=A0A9Q1JAA0_SYNKA|nr:hypothetical protein SKAU_G00056100 [Synaphobranchus kaupii]